MPKGKTLTDAEKAAKLAEKRAKFKQLANQRLPKLATIMRQIAALSAYSPSDEQTKFVMDYMQSEAAKVASAFQGKGPVASSLEIPD